MSYKDVFLKAAAVAGVIFPLVWSFKKIQKQRLLARTQGKKVAIVLSVSSFLVKITYERSKLIRKTRDVGIWMDLRQPKQYLH